MRENLLSTQLLRRGFLIEVTDSGIYLTDNAFTRINAKLPETIYLERDEIPFQFVSVGACTPYYDFRRDHERPLSDGEVLEALLRRIHAGYLIKTSLHDLPYLVRRPDSLLDENEINELFRWPIIRSESYIHDDQRTPPWFRENTCTPKIPICILESHIALLVKALSAVGCGVWYSCEGHVGKRHPRCELMGPIHALWAKYLLQDAANAGHVGLGVIRRHKRFSLVTHKVPRRPRDTVSLMRSQKLVMDIGQYLYENRIRLRDARVCWISKFNLKNR